MQAACQFVWIIVGIGFFGGGIISTDEQNSPPSDPMAKMEHARKLALLGKYQEALEELLWCFDEGTKHDPAFVGVRHSFLLAEIADLGKAYPPALDALRERRRAAELRVDETKGTWNHMFAMMELVSLNHSLGDDHVNLELYDKLRAEQPDSPILEFLQPHVADELRKTGRTAEADAAVREQETERPNRRQAALERAWPREPDVQLVHSTPAGRGCGYTLDQDQFKHELAAAKDQKARLDILARRWDQVVLAVAHCNVIVNTQYYQSMSYWQSGWLTSGTRTIESTEDLVTAHGAMKQGTALVRGDCRENIAITGAGLLSRGGLVHLYGDLDANIAVSGQNEIIIGGDITPNGSIDGDGIVRIFIGGDVAGRISNKGSATVWIHGNLTGEVQTGHPSTKLHIMGDFRGRLRPLNSASMTNLNVRGTMSTDDIQATIRHGWTQFRATIGTSDMPPGLYPREQRSAHSITQRGDAVWVIHSQSQ